jgi:membrane protease YdiL (CAAX protease family)
MSARAPVDLAATGRRTLWSQVLLVYAALESALWTVGLAQACFMGLTVALAVAWSFAEPRLRTELGLGRRTIGHGWWIALVGTGIAGLVLLAAWGLQTLRPPAGGRVVCANVAMSLIWALAQQFLLQSFFFLRLEQLLRSGRRAVIGAALLFASAHVPNPVLVPVTLAGGLILSEAFRRHRNLYPLAVAHALVALCLAISIPEAVLHDMRVGIAYLHFQP